ncbi:MAG: hemerythrin domain-containing protein [Gammaproteobacteria bacterium]|nr:hemerythrin domain-containing protein [Gammaproteobacteria bacterium]MDH3749483.1 hemerythrin domain-containing protein [Gammaproteobacteria bacterium]MDH3804961.1 hemerythrin domain-containing protein [Gammaproteobacteria bacterium]
MTPTEILSDEHRLIVAVLDCLDEAAAHLDSGAVVSPDFFLDAAEFVAGFADKCHHRKEEDILFVAMTARDMPQDSGPVAVMLREHDEGRQYTAAFRSAAEQMKSGNESAAADVVRNVFDYVNLLREHIFKEDHVLFPMAEQIIPADTMQRVSDDFQRVLDEDTKNGIPAKYRALAEKLSQYVSEKTFVA